MGKTVELQDAKSHLEELVTLARAGTDVVIAEEGTPLARLVPVTSARAHLRPRRPGLHRGAVAWISDDFDEPLPEGFWASEGQ